MFLKTSGKFDNIELFLTGSQKNGNKKASAMSFCSNEIMDFKVKGLLFVDVNFDRLTSLVNFVSNCK